MLNHTVLIVDDEDFVLNSLKRLLKDEAYLLMTTTNPKDVFDIIKKKRISLIISDHKMPEMTGVELFKIIKKIDPHIIRIILSGKADMQDTVRAINEGEVFRFITKPWDDEDLKITIRHALMQYDLWCYNRYLAHAVKQQKNTLTELEKQYPGITKGPEGKKGVYYIREEDLPNSMEELVMKYFPPPKVPVK